jgi:hypothetical protein
LVKNELDWSIKENLFLCRVQEEMIPQLTTCCCGIVSVRTAALLVAALFIVRRLTSESRIYLLPILPAAVWTAQPV